MNGMGENTTRTLKGLYKEQYPGRQRRSRRKKKRGQYKRLLSVLGSGKAQK